MAFNMANILIVATLGLCSIASAQFSGSLLSNPAGGNNFNLIGSHGFGSPLRNFGAGAFVAGNTLGGPLTTGAIAGLNLNGHSLSVQHTNTPGFGRTLQENVNVKLFNNEIHNVEANAFHSRVNLENGLNFDQVGGKLNYDHVNGLGASIGVSKIPQIGATTVELMGKANLWKATDSQTSLDVIGSVSKSNGPFSKDTSCSVGVSLSKKF